MNFFSGKQTGSSVDNSPYKGKAGVWSPSRKASRISSQAILLTAALLALLATSVQAQSITVNGPSAGPNQGGAVDDLFIGFQSPAGSVQTSTDYLIDLGQATLFASTSQILNLGQYGSDLRTIFGANWYNNTGVLWGAMASSSSAGASGNGINDLAQTLYVSTPTTAVGVNGSSLNRKSSGAQSPSSQRILQLLTVYTQGIYNSSYNGTPLASNAVAVTASDSQSWTSQNTYISGQYNKPIQASFTDTTASSAVLDLFRLAPGSGAGQNLGFLSIDNAGNMMFTPYALASGGGGGGGSVGPFNWTAGSGNWSVSANWLSNSVASNGVAASITGVSGGTITNDTVSSISSLTFSNGAGGYTLTATNAGQVLTVTAGITNNASSSESINLSIAGAGGVSQSGSGTLVLSQSNSYTGGTVLNGGGVAIGNNNALGSGTVTVSQPSSLIAGNAALSTTNAMALNAPTTFDTGANRWTNAGTLAGSGSLTKVGSGTLTIAASGSTYSGNSSVSAGSLQVAAGSSLGSGTVSVAAGATLSGSGTVGGIALQNGGLLTGGVDGSVGKLTVGGGMALSSGGIMNWKLSDANGVAGTGFDSFAVGGLLDLTGLGTGSTLRFNILNGITGTANFLNSQNSQWLVVSAGSITGFSTNDFLINTAGFTNALGLSLIHI